MEVNQDRVKALMDQVREIHQSPENQARARYWQVVSHERWAPALIHTLPAPRDGGKIPFVVEPVLTMWSEILGFDTAAYYADPLTYLTAQLEMKVYHVQHFQDDTAIDKSFRILFAAILEGSLMDLRSTQSSPKPSCAPSSRPASRGRPSVTNSWARSGRAACWETTTFTAQPSRPPSTGT